MIEITYHRRLNSLEMHGHANVGKKGRDLVCAAASILAETLILNAEWLKEQGALSHLEQSAEDGSVAVWCKPKGGMDSIVTLVMDTICMGFAALAEKYPKKVQYTAI